MLWRNGRSPLYFAVGYGRHEGDFRTGGFWGDGRWLPILAAARLSENIPEVEQWLLTHAQQGLPG